MNTKYEDIIKFQYSGSQRDDKMSIEARAAQFAPFAALTGHSAAISEVARHTDSMVERSESRSEVLDRRYAVLKERIKDHPEINIAYFLPDEKKAGGSYVHIKDRVKGVDEYKAVISTYSGKEIPFICIMDMWGDIFKDME